MIYTQKDASLKQYPRFNACHALVLGEGKYQVAIGSAKFSLDIPQGTDLTFIHQSGAEHMFTREIGAKNP